MTRKYPEKYTTMALQKMTIERMSEMKQHPRETNEDVLLRLIKHEIQNKKEELENENKNKKPVEKILPEEVC